MQEGQGQFSYPDDYVHLCFHARLKKGTLPPVFFLFPYFTPRLFWQVRSAGGAGAVLVPGRLGVCRTVEDRRARGVRVDALIPGGGCYPLCILALSRRLLRFTRDRVLPVLLKWHVSCGRWKTDVREGYVLHSDLIGQRTEIRLF